ncbi:hypothetical protein AB1Y20_016476 [Prymnesium parvum]|uniref:Uncharacterized protein n=1 Tax=Prymnesium parvum TaxID=97485 RepID=A0AB34IDE9_PRYPA
MHDPKLALRDKLTSKDGANSIGNATQQQADTVGCHATNDVLAESVFGTYDMVLRRCPGISMEAASGVAQAVRSLQMLSHGDSVARRKVSTRQQQPEYTGLLYTLPEHEQEALVDLARITVKEMRDIDRADHGALDEYKKERRKTNEQEELDALFTQYAIALSFFERWQQRGAQTMADVSRALSTFGSAGERDQEKLDWLREHIEMRTVGLGWTEFRAQWSSSADENVGTIPQLKAHLKDILCAEAARRDADELPSKTGEPGKECPAPLLQRKTFKALGTPTVQASALCSGRTELTAEQLLEAAQRRRVELEATGEIDWVGDRQPYAAGQGPTFDNSLVGKMLEVRWRYRCKETGQPIYIWCEGKVLQALL